jgi:hypothetical protein
VTTCNKNECFNLNKWSKMAINFDLHTYIVWNRKIPLFYFAAKRRCRTRFLTAETKFQLFNRSISSPGWETFLCSWSFLHIHIHTYITGLLSPGGVVYVHSGIVSACHWGDWSYGSWDRISQSYREVAF